MSADELLTTCRQAGVILTVEGDSLSVDAPRGALTPALRAALVRCKSELLTRLLAPVTEFVSLRGGLTVPAPALRLAVDLEARGFRQSVDTEHQYQIEPSKALTDQDRTGIARWRLHLGAIVSYEAPTCA